MSYQDAVRAKEWLNVIGYIVVWIHDEWRVMTKRNDIEKFKNDAQLIAFAREKGWEG